MSYSQTGRAMRRPPGTPPDRRAVSLVGWLVAAFLAAVPLLAGGASAGELLMFEEPGCPWCARFRAEIGPIYEKTEEGRRFPLRSLPIHAPEPPAGIALTLPPRFSPTFVLVDDTGCETGRIVGYPGEDFFWGLLTKLIVRLDAGGAGDCRRAD